MTTIETTTGSDTYHLSAERLTDGITVLCAEGGRWWPSDEAAAEIEAADDPAAAALAICDAEPGRGVWHD
jgi:hypothetical protein